MKILFLLLCLPAFAIGETLQLDRYDQLKLAELLAQIPAEAKEEKSEKDDSSSGVLKRFMTFPKVDNGLRIFCEAHYYNDSPYVSSAACILEINPNGVSVEHSYDEYKIKIQDKRSASGLFRAIPHGLPRRELRSWERDAGINFKGNKGEIFRYYFSCAESECEVLVSEKGLI